MRTWSRGWCGSGGWGGGGGGAGAGGGGGGGGGGEVAATARQTLEASLDQLKPLATAVIDRLRGLAHPPHQVNVEFGVKLTAHAGMVIAASGGEANLTVRLCWDRPGTLG